ncbi:MAG: hypothetical protein FWE45_04710 [Firmicutes bacterium]|nr:hypothetical protein [Bacillota bacterium]
MDPFKIDIQLVKLVDSPPTGQEWLWELKYDGWRILAFLDNGQTTLVTRNKNDATTRFSPISHILENWLGVRSVILDGEMVVVDKDGHCDFHALRGRKLKNLAYVVFDILSLDGNDLRQTPLVVRKQILADLIKDAPTNIIQSQYLSGNVDELFKAVCDGGHEGLIGKLKNSHYTGNRNGSWIKYKCPNYTRKYEDK